MANPFFGEILWSRTDDRVVAVVEPSCVGWLCRCLHDLGDMTSHRITQHAQTPLYCNGSPALRAVIHERAGHCYGPEVNTDNPAIELEALCEMTYQYTLLRDVLPHSGGVIELAAWDQQRALLWLLSDIRAVLPVKVNSLLRRSPYLPQYDEEVLHWQNVERQLDEAIGRWHALGDADPPSDLARELTA